MKTLSSEVGAWTGTRTQSRSDVIYFMTSIHTIYLMDRKLAFSTTGVPGEESYPDRLAYHLWSRTTAPADGVEKTLQSTISRTGFAKAARIPLGIGPRSGQNRQS